MASTDFQSESFISDDLSLQHGSRGNRITAKDIVVQRADALKITGIDDKQFIKVVNKWIQDSKDFYKEKYNLPERRKELEKYRFGRQLGDVKQEMEDYNSTLVDSAMWESESYLTPIVFAKMPDIIVKPGNDTPQSRQTADDISKIVSTDVQSRDRKRVLKQAFAHHPVYLTGVVKAFWNPVKGPSGDYDFKAVLPELVVVDHTAPGPDVEDMRFVAEYVQRSVKEWIMHFPDKKEDFFKQLDKDGIFNDKVNQNNEAGLNSIVRAIELHFKWYVDAGKGESDKPEYEEIHGVAWIYKDVLLGKMKDPNWDWSGEKRTFSYDQKVDENQLKQGLAGNAQLPGLQIKEVFHNYFDKPRFPYYFMSYDRWGKQPIDETSRLEQTILIQKQYDRTGRRLAEKSATRLKHIWSTASGLKKEDLAQFDPNDPYQDFVVSGDPRETHAEVPPEIITPPEVELWNSLRQRIFEMNGVNQPVRGQVEASAPATSTQIGREGDFTRADDLTDDTVNACAEWMSHWILQFIKLRYTEDHFVRLLGPDGSPVFIRVNRDMIEDGMEVSISASGVDKLKRQQNAFDLAKLKMNDPYNMFRDLDLPDPEGRAQDLMMFLTSPQMFSQWLQSNRDPLLMTQNAGTLLNGVPSSPQASEDIMTIQSGQIPNVPTQVDGGYMGTMENFIHTQLPSILPALEQQIPGFQQALAAWMQQVEQVAQQTAQAPQPGQQPQQASGQSQPNVQAGPISSGPSAQSTAQTPTQAPTRTATQTPQV